MDNIINKIAENHHGSIEAKPESESSFIEWENTTTDKDSVVIYK